MRVLVAAMPFAGHVAPLAGVAAELCRRGHDVVAYTGSRYAERFTAVGATWLPWEHAPDFDDRDLTATFPQVGDGKGVRAVTTNLEHVFLRTGTGQARDIRAAGPVDVLVADQLAIGSALVAEATGTPWASVWVVPLGLASRDLPPFGLALRPGRGPAGRARDALLRAATQRLMGRRLGRVVAEVRTAAGLPSTTPAGGLDALTSPYLALATGAPEIDYPRTDLPATVHFVGQLAPPPAGHPVPDWWAGAGQDGRPLVHVTQGTYDLDPADLLRPALAGLADLDVQVAAATGTDPLPAEALPANARQSPFLPYDELLPRTSVMVTNGGWGGVLAALAAGVPLVVAASALDKPEIARRVAWSGAGIDLRTGRPRPAQVADAVRRILDDPAYRERARAVGAALRRLGGTARAADLVEWLAESRAAVPRPDGDPWAAIR
jgi:UDP:flavonoid glycosyltransferase YjiC (YdhE family)